MTRLQFISFFLLFSENYDMRIVHRVAYLVGEGKQFIKPTAFVKYLTIIFGHDLEERLAFAFKVYDTRSEGILSGAVLAAAVENFFTEGEEDELTAMRSDMVEILLKKFDKYSEGGGSITFDRYRNVVLKSPDLLEFLGKIYPSRSQAILIAHCMNILTEIPRMTCK
ncbi:uncharacterized protein LOC115624226 isoform X2 [Scaptodrosophila lebanonensis]|nr:uncharacterized protein LOC115624226 isoform X2 [Scaptodrosophila lebanonensis]